MSADAHCAQKCRSFCAGILICIIEVPAVVLNWKSL
jgi:hypothetical protein